MAAPTEIYVDPSIAANSGAGTIGDPYGDLQYALDSVTRDATNGDRFNIKAGTDEILSAALSLTTYGTPALGAPLIFQGYTSAAGDGGIGGISGNGSVGVISTNLNYINFRHLHLHNCGSADIVGGGIDFGSVIECELDTTDGNGINHGEAMLVMRNHFHNIALYGVAFTSNSDGAGILWNYFKDETKKFERAIGVWSNRVTIIGNIISLNSTAGYGIVGSGQISGNSVYNAAAGTNIGIWMLTAATRQSAVLANNLVEGWSGAGGRGLQVDAGSDTGAYGFNALYNNATASTISADFIDLGDNETPGSSPFAKSGSDTFANRFVYFAPLDVGNVWGGAYPSGSNLDKGAVQHASAAGGLLTHPGMGGGFRG